MKLRDYQEKAILDVVVELKKNRGVMLQSPTGSGKSVIIAELVKYYVNKGNRVLFCVDRKELVEQIKNTLFAQKIYAGIIMQGYKPCLTFPTQIASIQTLNRRHKPKADIIIIDEAHASKSSSYKKLWELYPNAKFIGLTATPYRLSGEGFTDLFDVLIQTKSINDMITEGYLVPFKHLICSVPDFSKVRVDKGEYVEEETLSELSTAPVVESYLKYCEGKKGIAFCVNVEHSIQTAQKYQDSGIVAVHVDAETPKQERERIIEEFKKGNIKVLCNVGLFTTGFDVPDVAFVQILRMTKSLSLYLQMLGRGSRTLKGLIDVCKTQEERRQAIESSKKPFCYILDHAGLFYEHGLGNSYHDWQEYFLGIDKKTKKEREEGKKEKLIAYEDEEGILRVSKEFEEVKGMTLRELTPELETLVFFEKYLQDLTKWNNRKLISAFFKYSEYLEEKKISWTNELFNYVEHRLKIANKKVDDCFKFKTGFLYYKRKEYVK